MGAACRVQDLQAVHFAEQLAEHAFADAGGAAASRRPRRRQAVDLVEEDDCRGRLPCPVNHRPAQTS